jgi:virginiamycin A acetyltransferase
MPRPHTDRKPPNTSAAYLSKIIMPFNLAVTQALLDDFFSRRILLRFNSPAPAAGQYGWLREDQTLALSRQLTIEQNVGLYGGAYVPMIGGMPSSGLCSIGAFSYSYSPLPDYLKVGRYCSISSGLRFIDSHHPTHAITTSAMTFRPHNHLFADHVTDAVRKFAEKFQVSGEKPAPIIEHDVWIGANVTLAMGITLGTGSIVAANSTVTKSTPPYAIVGGNPAVIIGFRIAHEVIPALLSTRWWDHRPDQVFALGFENPATFVDAFSTQRPEPMAFDSILLAPP